MQDTFDKLHEKSKKNYNFTKLIQYIADENNILLAYRNIKKNKGSKTAGTDNLDISFLEKMDRDKFVKRIQNKLQNYQPKSVRRVEIPKPNGKTRPLGIPCIEDRLIQQCIKQVLEPICEAKFHNHSYGFRPNRSTKHAIGRVMSLINKVKLHYVVDIDIRGFFDNVNHSKLKKQLWNLGIRDKNLISIIGKILKSEIEGEGIPIKGTPQGGIISPLLSNVVLNELDWWISDQWETIETKHEYNTTSNKYRAARTTSKLKEIFLVRYADDFKIFCRDYKTAQKIFNAIMLWLRERLNLDISPEKSQITNLRKNYTEFLGFKLKAKIKGKRYLCQSKMSDKALSNTIKKIKEQIKILQKNRESKQIIRLNSIILGSHNYFNCATHVSLDFAKIHFLVTKSLDIRLKNYINNKPQKSKAYEKLYGKYNGKIRTIANITIFPIYGCRTKPPMCFSQDICNYNKTGREKIHNKLKGYQHLIEHLHNNIVENDSTELIDNKISLIVGQQGKCGITKELLKIGEMECHHKKAKHLKGTDEYKNLIWLKTKVHKLIHATLEETIKKYLNILNLDDKGLEKVNSLRKQVGNSVI